MAPPIDSRAAADAPSRASSPRPSSTTDVGRAFDILVEHNLEDVFPTGIDRRDDLGSPDRFDVYYGMADNRIGVARLEVPEFLPP
ncbi:MAG: hypothetical protein WBS21_06110, partial [Candidatus Acidiferrum sp.]